MRSGERAVLVAASQWRDPWVAQRLGSRGPCRGISVQQAADEIPGLHAEVRHQRPVMQFRESASDGQGEVQRGAGVIPVVFEVHDFRTEQRVNFCIGRAFCLV